MYLSCMEAPESIDKVPTTKDVTVSTIRFKIELDSKDRKNRNFRKLKSKEILLK